ncbi:MAG: hypothetical protein HC852_20420 [Acaryochloridaceae cyanobacterium RU_4_10]|nr:hypothetical protein [Acaryochloridaceae cyanobacterium RU_4_10]
MNLVVVVDWGDIRKLHFKTISTKAIASVWLEAAIMFACVGVGDRLYGSFE